MMGLKRQICMFVYLGCQFQSYNLSQNHTIKEPRMKRQVGLLRLSVMLLITGAVMTPSVNAKEKISVSLHLSLGYEALRVEYSLGRVGSSPSISWLGKY